MKKKKCYIHNIFIANPKWQVIMGCYWWGKKIHLSGILKL